MASFASIDHMKKVEEDDNEESSSSTTTTTNAEKVLGIEKSGPKKLKTSEMSSIFNLKNEFLRKKNSMTKTKLNDPYKGGKSSVLMTKKDEKEAQQKEAELRKKRIAENERGWRAEEEERLLKANQRLKEKAELYERLAQGNIVLEHSDNIPVEFMVDFSTKKRIKQDEEEEEEAGPSRQTRDPIPDRYHHSEEQRVYGVSHMRFSKNEEKRKEEIQNLLDMSKKTKDDGMKLREQNKAQDEKRREKINRLRKLKGLEPLKEASPEPEIDLDEIPMPEPHETPEEKHKRLMKSNREWDRGKGLYTQWIEKQRDERDDEFRPPDSY